MDKSTYDRMVRSGVLKKGVQDPVLVQELVDAGEAFINLEDVRS